MPIAKTRTSTSNRSSAPPRAAAKAAARVDWSKAVSTPGGGVAETIAALRKSRGLGKKPAKEQVAIRLDQDVVGALRASGPGWQTRVNTALKQWLATQPRKRKARAQSAG